ncbi:MAG: rhodanese-like domain-containing protein [Chloroflexi bacterium]|nr:rhodanese-like domain-containing protein [Chloroflexota bacterium]
MNIILVAAVCGILSNIINPFGIEIKENSPQKLTKAVTIDKEAKETSSKITSSKETKLKSSVGIITAAKKNVAPEISGVNKIGPKIEDINLTRAKELFDRGEAVFIDARAEHTYLEKHIKGALSLSASRFSRQYKNVKDKITKDTLLIIYCSSTTCQSSDYVANNLKDCGYINLKIFTGGWTEWLNADYPTQGFKVDK